ncbi:hypothetical protein GQ43DRAFT_392848 [Delitschia confertaspora ATCC 74209]|uniref:Genetic interactor of prohibitins 3, mitochondrial n=1 Tax=Delitschia confertaspora ATCC 74209 TaxID=1513339 RepID=A0A9P4JT23_9PLEO|nr:hypothetical protein GQ43DRAFT_392848 [Delitschia confertaspora ATCC 74209]
MRPVLRQASGIVHHEYALLRSVPVFLCPALIREPYLAQAHRDVKPPATRSFSSFKRNQQEAFVEAAELQTPPTPEYASKAPSEPFRTLPLSCPGCGAPTQVLDKGDAGYYNLERNAVKAYLYYDPTKSQDKKQQEDIYTKALQQADPKILEEAGMDKDVLNSPSKKELKELLPPPTPICERCHNLLNHRIGTPIAHPTIDSIHATIAESPYKRNHIYHVVDAADFPLSLVPNLQSSLKLPKLRTQNRRARHRGWMSGDRIAEVSFIITRSDLLAPLKEQVDKLMPYMQQTLRTALGRAGRNLRLGNVHMVSAKRGWWTTSVKEQIWERGGAAWMVGKVNVGKSALFETVFPKARGGAQDVRKIRSQQEREKMLAGARSMKELLQIQEDLAEEDEEIARAKEEATKSYSIEEEVPENDPEAYDEDSLLPPPQPYTPYPTLPVATSLPGTTASPIRIPFGNKKGELIDLPGLARTTPELSSFVKSEDQDDLVMKSRIAAQRHILKPGQSLVLGGGLIRITPVTKDTIFIVSPFTPLEPHVSSTEKAATLQSQTRESGVPSIVLPGVGDQMQSAGRFPLQWDATKQLAGPLTSKMAGKMKPENLPFTIYSLDVLVEGVGWIEVSCQVRKPKGWVPFHLRPENQGKNLQNKWEKHNSKLPKKADEADVPDAFEKAGLATAKNASEATSQQHELFEQFPEIEVFSPLGKFIGVRQPMCASVLGGPKPVSKRDRKARPRRSMVSVKAQRKPKPKE